MEPDLAPAEEAPVRVGRSDPTWPDRFEAERALLGEAIAEWAPAGIHHVGGTAVAGVDAEPVIDILVGTDGSVGARCCLGPLIELGYDREPSPDGQVQRFRKPRSGSRAYDLRLAAAGSSRFREEIAFRDLLRSNPQVALGYASLKRDLARRYAGDRRRYSAAKAELIQAVLLAAELP